MEWRSFLPVCGAFILSTGLIMPSSLAQGVSQLSQAIDCRKATATTELNFCTQREADAADKKLNQIYQRLTAVLKGSKKLEQLITAQLAWIKYRDATCAFERWDGGTGATYSYLSCIARVTQQRTKDLEADLDRR